MRLRVNVLYLLISRTITERCVHSNAEHVVGRPRCVAPNDVRIVGALCVRIVVQRRGRYFTLQIGCVDELWVRDGENVIIFTYRRKRRDLH